MRYRLGALVAIVALLVATVGLQSATAGGPTLTRVRIELWGTSVWQSVTFEDAWIGGYQVEALTPGASVVRGGHTVLLKGSGTVSTTVSVLLEVANVSSYTIELAKDKGGESHATLFRTNLAAPTNFLTLDNYLTSGPCVVSENVDRSELVGEAFTMPEMDPRRLVLAFYYPWYNSEYSFASSTWYDRPTGSWRTDLQESVQDMVDQAAGAGVDGFIVSWDGENHGPHLDRVLEAAKTHSDFFVTVTLNALYWYDDGQFDVNGIIDAGRAALSRAADPAFLLSGGRPVLFVYGAHQLGIDAWNTVKAELSSTGLNPFLIGEATESGWGFDGAFTYNPNDYDYRGLRERNVDMMRALRYQAQVDPSIRQGLWAATVSPGQNESHLVPLLAENRDRQDGDRYRMTWEVAIPRAPEWILITSWNEWYEATHIAPSERFGETALDITRVRAASFHNPTTGAGAAAESGSVLTNLPLPPLKLGLP